MARAKRQEEELEIARTLVRGNDEDARVLGLAMLSPRVAKIVEARAARKADDPMTIIATEAIRKSMDKSLKELKDFGRDDQPPESFFEKLANSELGQGFGQALGQAFPHIIAAGQNGTPAQNGALPAPGTPGAGADVAGEPPPASTPEALLLLLEERTPEAVADYIMDWLREERASGQRGDAEQTVHALCNDSAMVLTAKLQGLARANTEWSPVAQWLLDHNEARKALIEALKFQYSELLAGDGLADVAGGAATPPSANGQAPGPEPSDNGQPTEFEVAAAQESPSNAGQTAK